MIKFNFIFFLLTFSLFAQENKTDSTIRKQIEEYNSSFATAFTDGNINDLTEVYTNLSILMPEHSRQRTGKDFIADFYKQWLSQSRITSYKKSILEIQDFGNYILEIGNFTEVLDYKDYKPFEYTGKYMVLWKKDSKSMTIAAEIWGSDTYLEDRFIPQIDDSMILPTEEYFSSDKLTKEVKAGNSKIKELVHKRLGEEHAKMFMPDAMYLTYYTPILSGKNEITAYFKEHEKPGSLVIEKISIQTSGIIDAKKAIIEFGFYSVDWRDGDSNGNVKGKSINVWKRNDKGELMLFRQMVNHD